MELYYKKGDEFVPMSFRKIIKKNWNNSLIMIRVGTETDIPTVRDLDEIVDAFSDADALRDLDNTSFLFTSYDMSFKKIYDMEKRK